MEEEEVDNIEVVAEVVGAFGGNGVVVERPLAGLEGQVVARKVEHIRQ